MLRTSESITELAKALAKAQGSFSAAKKDTPGQVGNVIRKYADMASVVEATKAGLAENGLSVVQAPTAPSGGWIDVTTRLMHESGEWMESTLSMPSGGTPQTMGSAITYCRRYSLMAILGVAPDDDDGKAASEAAANTPPPARVERDTPAKALFRRVKDASANPDIASSLRALSETKQKALTAREYEADREWAQAVSELLDALETPAAA